MCSREHRQARYPDLGGADDAGTRRPIRTHPRPRRQLQAILGDAAAETPKDKKAAAEKILRSFAARAYRRPVNTDEVQRLVKLFELADKNGDKILSRSEFQDAAVIAVNERGRIPGS